MSEKLTKLFECIDHQIQQYPKNDAISDKRNGEWVKTSIHEFKSNVDNVSKGLIKLGIEPGDKIALISTTNRSEWNTMDMAILQVGAIDVPVYPTISESDYEYIFNDASIKMCFVSDEDLLRKIEHIKPKVSSLDKIYIFDEVAGAKNWKEVLELGKDGDQEEVEKRKKAVNPDELATLIYTSGTTGNPKGVMLSHANILGNAIACLPRVPVDHNYRALSFLPVCHVYERMMQYLYMFNGVSIYFAESLETIGDNLKEIQPGMFTAVPRLLEKVFDKIVAKGQAAGGIKTVLFNWALNLGLRYEINGANGAWYEFQLGIARKLVFSKWQEALGGNIRAIACGSAALQPRLARVFCAAGLPVFEGYGLTETSPCVTVNSYSEGFAFGTVGPVLDDVDVKIAEDGEILVKGPNVMLGYYKQEEKTAEVMSPNGWFHTGDIGEFSGKYLRITDRKKEIFKTSGGKYIAPQQIENKMKESFYIEQIMVIGEAQKHPAAIIVPAFLALTEWCKSNGCSIESNKAMVENPKVIALMTEEINKANEQFGSWEQIKKFELLDYEWTIANGELTPTMKVKRKVVAAKCADLFTKIYGN